MTTLICAPAETCFDLARDVEVHCRTAAATGERVVGGASGRLELGDEVTFEGTHFGLRLRLTARIVELTPPHHFVDEMQEGPFRSLSHRHEFHLVPGGTRMVDTLNWSSPAGWLGRAADPFIRAHLLRFLRQRNSELKRLAETATAPGT